MCVNVYCEIYTKKCYHMEYDARLHEAFNDLVSLSIFIKVGVLSIEIKQI